MIDTLLLDNKTFTFETDDLPCLIQYGEKMGGSHLSVVIVADLFAQGAKIVFLCAYPMAREKFMEQIDGDYSKVLFVNAVIDFKEAMNFQVVIVANESLFSDATTHLTDFTERVIFIKNIETFSDTTFDIVMDSEKVILSGDLDTCVAKERIVAKLFQTVIAFNRPSVSLPLVLPELAKYTAYLKGPSKMGIIEVRQ